MMNRLLCLAAPFLFLAACGGGNAANHETRANAPSTEAGEINYSDPESVLAAYVKAIDAGDMEALKKIVLPSERDSLTAATGTDMQCTYEIVDRKHVSDGELHISIRITNLPDRAPARMREPRPHALMREGERWYVSAFKTAELKVK
jgi:hypothetical protein